MEPIQAAFIHRARSALDMAVGSIEHPAAKVKAFSEIAHRIAVAEHGQTHNSIATCTNSIVKSIIEKDANAFTSGAWNGDAAELAAAFVGSIAEGSILDQVARYATVLPVGQRRALIATGSAASNVGEGELKAIRKPGLDAGDIEPVKVAALLVLSRELDRFGGAFRKILETELSKSVTRGTNAAVVAALVDSSTASIPSGADPIETLRAGLQAAGASEGYVIALPAGDCAWLATHSANRGAGIRGGEFVPGVHLVAVDDSQSWTFIPASRLAIRDWGLELRSAEHADVNMADSPEGPSQTVSLFQTNSICLVAERLFLIGGDKTGVVVAAGS